MLGFPPAVDFVEAEAEAFDLHAADAFLEGFLEGAADGHGFADGFHLRGQRFVGVGEFFEGPARDFNDDVVDGGLEAGDGFFGDVVGQFIQRVADGEFGGELGDGEAGGFGGEGGGAGDARVHFDDDHVAVFGVDAELDVGAAGFDADGADDGDGGVAHALVFLVGQRLRGGDGDGVAGVDAHGVEVFDGADDDDVVGDVAHDFEFVFLPADEGLVDLDFGDHGGIEAAAGEGFEFFHVVGDAGAGAAEGEGGADDAGQAGHFDDFAGVGHGVGEAGLGALKADLGHEFFEDGAVFAAADGFAVGTDHFDVVLGEDAGVEEGDGGVEAGLAAEGGEEGVGAFFFDDFGDGFDGDGLDVGAVGHLGVGHDGGGVGVDEDDFVAFLFEGFAGLGAGIIELAALSDDDGAGADDEDGVDVGAFGHGFWALVDFFIKLSGYIGNAGEGQGLEGILGGIRQGDRILHL